MNKPLVRSSRKMICEISQIYHCSIVGTCLTLEEVRKIIIKAGFSITGDVKDFELHGIAVNSAGKNDNIAKIMNRFIEKKYSRIVSFYAKVKTVEELENYWEKALNKGDIPGAYWAVMTHPYATQDFLDRIFGDVHMLSHLNCASRGADIQKVHDIEKICTSLKESKRNYKKRIKELEESLKILESKALLTRSIEEKLDIAKKRINRLESGKESVELREEIIGLVNMLELEKLKAERAENNIKLLYDKFSVIVEENRHLCEELKVKNDECLALEDDLKLFLERDRSKSYEKFSEENCSLLNLYEKTILYVGGKSSVVSRCRELVEKIGGNFIHHDGGIEESLSRLPEVLNRADAVFCPLNCISHNACHLVKKMCRQYSKPAVMLRSSGLSSFSKGMHDIFLENKQA